MSVLGDWSAHADRGYKGKIGVVFISTTQTCTTELFIDQYLEDRRLKVSNINRDLISYFLEEYPEKPPYLLDDLKSYLNRRLR